MAQSGGLITAPVSIYDLQQCFAVVITKNGENKYSADLGTIIAKGLGSTIDGWTVTSRQSINKWSKYKAVKFATVKQLTAAQWVMTNYGIINIPTWQKLNYMAEFLLSTNRGSLTSLKWPECDQDKGSLSQEYWAYDKPTGGVSEPFRLPDFSNYWHFAEQPLGTVKNNTVTIEPYGSMIIKFNYGAQNVRTLKLSDLTWPGSASISINNMYFGAILKKVTAQATTTYAVTSKIGGNYVTVGNAPSHEWTVYIEPDQVQADFAGTWKIFPLISQQAFDMTAVNLVESQKFIAPVVDIPPDVAVTIQYAQIVIANAVGWRDNSQQRYARFSIVLRNDESIFRNYRVTVNLFNRFGESTSYVGSTTGQVAANSSTTVNMNVNIAENWSDFEGGSFTVTCVVTDNLKFKRESNWPNTILAEQAPQ